MFSRYPLGGVSGYCITANAFDVPFNVGDFVTINFSARGFIPEQGCSFSGPAGIYTVSDSSSSPSLECVLDYISGASTYFPGDTVPAGTKMGAAGAPGAPGATGTAGAGGWLMFGASNSGTSASIRYLHPQYSDSVASTTAIAFAVPAAGTIRKLRFLASTAGVGSGSVTYQIYKNGANTISITVPATQTAGSNLFSSTSIVAGDTLACVCFVSGTVTSGHTRPIITAEIV